MDFVENVSIKTDAVKTTETVKNRFDKYNGAWKNRLSIEEIDLQLNELRKEWERVL
jgi:prefoldin subunit 5